MVGIGPDEMIIVGVIALLLFGRRLPEVSRSFGRALRLRRLEQYEAERTARAMEQAGRLVAPVGGIFLVIVLVASLLRNLGYF